MRTVGFGMGDGQAVRLGQGVMWEEEKECTEGDGGNGGHGFPVDQDGSQRDRYMYEAVQ